MSPAPGGVVDRSMAVGVDLVAVADVARSLEVHGERYRARVFTEHEQRCCEGTAEVAAQGLAARFAAKEAVIKLLRPTAHLPEWRSIEVRRHDGGWCSIRLSGEAARLAAVQGIGEIAVSLSHEGPLAVAVAVATRGDATAAEAVEGSGK